MSVVVKGMKMPKTCEECSFGYEEDVAWMACIPQGVSVRKESVQGICDLHCPLVEVPAPHGRLIDEDALIERMESDAEQMEEPLAKMFTYAAINDVKHSESVIKEEDGDAE